MEKKNQIKNTKKANVFTFCTKIKIKSKAVKVERIEYQDRKTSQNKKKRKKKDF